MTIHSSGIRTQRNERGADVYFGNELLGNVRETSRGFSTIRNKDRAHRLFDSYEESLNFLID